MTKKTNFNVGDPVLIHVGFDFAGEYHKAGTFVGEIQKLYADGKSAEIYLDSEFEDTFMDFKLKDLEHWDPIKYWYL